MTHYVLAALAGMWLANGIALLAAPHAIIRQLRELLLQSPAIVRWEFLTVIAGLFLLITTQELPSRWLWAATAGGMMAKGAFLSLAPPAWQRPILAWCLERDDIDYRFWGLSLCALAVLLLHALGWIGHTSVG